MTEKNISKEGTSKRSPNYPSINLEQAISMVEKIYVAYHQSSVPAHIAIEATGYSSKSSTGRQILPALSQYELIEVTRGGDKHVKLTNLAFIILRHHDSQEKNKAIKEAALKPSIFNKLYKDHVNTLPLDRLIAWELESKYKFNPKSVEDVIKVFKDTMSFAKVYETGIIEAESRDIVDSEEVKQEEEGDNEMIKAPMMPMQPLFSGTEKEIANYPIKGGTIRLLASVPVTQKAIEKLIKLLEISKEDFPENEITTEETN